MSVKKIKIELFNKKEKIIETIYVEQLSHHKYRMVDNALTNCKLTLGTEFKTKLNREGKHEITKIIKESNFVTRRFFLSTKFKTEDYKMLGAELQKRGGFWQVDFGGIATVNIPKDFEFNVDQVMSDLGLNLVEITE